VHLSELRWPEIDRPVVAVPVGSCEQHGPHLPLATDTIVAEALASVLAARHPDIVVGPSLTVTASGEHQGFPGTLSIGAATTEQVVIELVRSADWADGVVLVNGHGGNAAPVGAAVQRLVAEGRRVLAWWPRPSRADLHGDLHAGATETALLLALRPDLVRTDLAVSGPTPALADLVRDGVLQHSPTGVLGDPTGADAATGRRLLEALADDLVAAVDRWHP
jgi:mycofactocin precursor peptide peptidase